MVAKRVQHVPFNNVGQCCINMLHPFGRALSVTVTFLLLLLLLVLLPLVVVLL